MQRWTQGKKNILDFNKTFLKGQPLQGIKSIFLPSSSVHLFIAVENSDNHEISFHFLPPALVTESIYLWPLFFSVFLFRFLTLHSFYLAFSGSVPHSQNVSYQDPLQEQILPHTSFGTKNKLVNSFLKVAETLGRAKLWCKAPVFIFPSFPAAAFCVLLRTPVTFTK